MYPISRPSCPGLPLKLAPPLQPIPALGINIGDTCAIEMDTACAIEMDTAPVHANSDPSCSIRVKPTESQDLSWPLPTDIQGTGNPVLLNDNDGFTTVVNN